MENSKLKEIFSNLKSVVEDLEAEIYSNPNAYLKPKSLIIFLNSRLNSPNG